MQSTHARRISRPQILSAVHTSVITKLSITKTFLTRYSLLWLHQERLKYDASFKLNVVDCVDVPDGTVDNELDPYYDALADADMLELYNSNSEDRKKLS